MASLFFKNVEVSVDDSWSSFFSANQSILKEIESKIGSNYTPKTSQDIFKIFKLPKDKIKYVIVGQDPYPAADKATGRCFEVSNTSWVGVPQSLKPILCATYSYSNNRTFLDYEKVIEQIELSLWSIHPPNVFFEKLETDKGVFLLNKSLTCELGSPGSHTNYWAPFINLLVRKLSKNKGTIWFLLGSKAQELEREISKDHLIVKSIHPSFCFYESPPPVIIKQRVKRFVKEFRYDLIQ